MAASKEKLPIVLFNTAPQFDDDGVQSTSGIRTDGKEETDPIPVAPPVGYTAPPDLMTMIRTMIQSEQLRQELAKEDFETFEEADDFDIADDPLDPYTEYEKVFFPPDNPVPEVPLKPASPPAPSPPTEVLDTSVPVDTSTSLKTPVVNPETRSKGS